MPTSFACVVQFKKEMARLDCKRKRWDTEMFDKWQMHCTNLLKTDPIESVIARINQSIGRFDDKLEVEDDRNPDPKLAITKSVNKQIENNQDNNVLFEASPMDHSKKVFAKVDCGRYKEWWNKEYQNKRFEEWRKQRGFKWSQKQNKSNSVHHKDNQLRIFSCLRFNKCAVLYTH